MVKQETEEKRFLKTKAFHDFQDHLQKNRILLIKGNTGDGKTSTAVRLLHWVIEEQQCRKPLQLHEIKKLDLLAPNSYLITFIDGIFGEKDVGRMDVHEWNKRITDVKTLFVDEQIPGNFLIITIRNEIFNALAKCSLGAVFTEGNIIDIRLDKYNINEEKQKLLEMYQPENFSRKDDEKRKILAYAPDIGFPQCCQLFCNSVELQKRRVEFFKKPILFFIDALSKLRECSAILFLFLNNGTIKVKDLDPNGDKVNKTLLEQAFRIDLLSSKIRTAMEFEEKVEFVKESLDKLSGYLVRKGKHWLSRDDVYIFDHHSIFVTVALLFGDKTPVGYIQNCPKRFLSHLTTSKTSSDMVAISSDHYTCLCERLLREFECEIWVYDDSFIGSLDVWGARTLVIQFMSLLKGKKVDKLTLLSSACFSGSKECVVQLLCDGVKPDKGTPLWPLITRGEVDCEAGDVDILKAVATYLNDAIKHDLLNEACLSGSEECVLYLLREGVKPEKDTPWWSLITRGHHGIGDVDLLKKVIRYLNDEIKLDLLNEACDSGSVECVSYLLCEGVKPTKDTLFPVLEKGIMRVLRKLLFYDVTPTARDYFNNNVLHEACSYGEEEMVTVLCHTYPYLVHDTNEWGETILLSK